MQKAEPNGKSGTDVGPDDVTRVLGRVDTETLLAILALHPSMADLEEAALRAAGDDETLGGMPATGIVADILEIIESEEEEEGLIPSRAGSA